MKKNIWNTKTSISKNRALRSCPSGRWPRIISTKSPFRISAGLMKIKLFEDSWNGISVVDIARELKFPEGEIADSRIYNAFYAKKRKTTEYLERALDSLRSVNGKNKPRIL